MRTVLSGTSLRQLPDGLKMRLLGALSFLPHTTPRAQISVCELCDGIYRGRVIFAWITISDIAG